MPVGLNVGDKVVSGAGADIKSGNALCLRVVVRVHDRTADGGTDTEVTGLARFTYTDNLVFEITYAEERLMSRILAMNEAGEKKVVKTWSRATTIFPQMVGHTIAVYDGRKHVPPVHSLVVFCVSGCRKKNFLHFVAAALVAISQNCLSLVNRLPADKGQKVNPHGLRVGVISAWDTQWYADKKDFGKYIKEDLDTFAICCLTALL